MIHVFDKSIFAICYYKCVWTGDQNLQFPTHRARAQVKKDMSSVSWKFVMCWVLSVTLSRSLNTSVYSSLLTLLAVEGQFTVESKIQTDFILIALGQKMTRCIWSKSNKR